MDRRNFEISVLGCGRIAKNHFEAIARIDGLTLSAVCGSVPARAQAAGDKCGVPWFTEYDQMLSKANCDAVVIATPSGLHPAHGVKAAHVCGRPATLAVIVATGYGYVRSDGVAAIPTGALAP